MVQSLRIVPTGLCESNMVRDGSTKRVVFAGKKGSLSMPLDIRVFSILCGFLSTTKSRTAKIGDLK